MPDACPSASIPIGRNTPLVGLDHVGLGIRDLAQAAKAFERMGFNLSPLSIHAGSAVPGGPTVPWGSGNRCAMFRRGYFELLGLVDPALPSNVKAMVERYEGLHIVALNCDSAEDAYTALIDEDVAALRPVALERDAAFGVNNEACRRAKFRNVYFDPVGYPEARFIVIEHETRDVLWQDHLLGHRNGAESLEAVYLVVPDMQASLKRLRPILGNPSPSGDALRFDLRQGVVWMLQEETLRRYCPVLNDCEVHRVAVVTFGVRSLAVLRDLLLARNIAFVPGTTWASEEPCIWVGPSEAAHAAIQFVQL